MTTKTVLLFLGLALALELYVNASPIFTTQESRNATPIPTENKSSKTSIKVKEDGGHKTNYEDATATLEFMPANPEKK